MCLQRLCGRVEGSVPHRDIKLLHYLLHLPYLEGVCLFREIYMMRMKQKKSLYMFKSERDSKGVAGDMEMICP